MEIDPEINISTVDVACAVIEHRYKYLILKRASHKENPGLWEFPGGKVLPGESLKTCLERELKEELSLKADVTDILASVESKIGSKTIRLFALKTEIESEPEARHFKDHTEMKWVSFENLGHYALTSPDLALVHQFQGRGARMAEVHHLELFSVAKFYGIFYGLFGTIIGIFIVFSKQNSPGGLASFGLIAKVVVACLLPVINFFVGALLGIVIGFFYNLIAGLVGGVKMRLRG